MSNWKPSKAELQNFAIEMQNPEKRAAYELRKIERERKKRAKSKYNYKRRYH